MKHVFVREGLHTGFWWESLVERDRLEDANVDRKVILK
jgi:hypothetical protein